jgi:hypothetical protein
VFNSYRRSDQLSTTKSTLSETFTHEPSNPIYSAMFPGGIAEYRLAETQSWCFHYAVRNFHQRCLDLTSLSDITQPFDSAPTLRRMSINGDTKHDYMSRESSLTVKSNGMYVVKGSEGKGRAPWEFRYLIEDRLTSSGEKMNGEKVSKPSVETYFCIAI